MTAPTLQLADAARMMREAMKNKAYLTGSRLGEDVAMYLRVRRKELADNSLEAYESTLNNFATFFADLALADFEPPVGTTRIEEWLDLRWGEAKPATYNRHLATVKDFFKFFALREQFSDPPRLHGDPTRVIRPAKKREMFRETFTEDQSEAIIASQEDLRDRIALRLLLHYGLRRGGLQAIQVKHFDHSRRKLAIFLKGGRVRNLPIPDPAFWFDLERWILETEARPGHHLMPARKGNRYGGAEHREKPMSPYALHKWWYRCLAKAGIVAEGVSNGERMHKARHSAGQRVLDKTGNLKATQELLMHKSIQTTGDTYTDWDDKALEATLRYVLLSEDDD